MLLKQTSEVVTLRSSCPYTFAPTQPHNCHQTFCMDSQPPGCFPRITSSLVLHRRCIIKVPVT
ncbi:unnamed protein product [Callosobruchus maculatus]|uniref:Uncharacterized protein n=1 Tax=Callosobruchus maculatus TaxID=64391 RepID=A0A653DU77_CALMS|nr:unnamed protein product [Callosobruchus maculatus]